MAGQTDLELIKNGVRLDGRKADELREVKITAGVLDNADGSCYLEWGNNKVYAGVFGPMECHPRHKQKADRAIPRTLRCWLEWQHRCDAAASTQSSVLRHGATAIAALKTACGSMSWLFRNDRGRHSSTDLLGRVGRQVS